MNPDLFILWLHVAAGGFLLLYTILSVGIVNWALLTRDPKTVARVFQLSHFADWVIGFPAYVLIPLSGIFISGTSGTTFADSWYALSVVLYVCTGLLWLPALYQQWRQSEAIDTALQEGRLPEPELLASRRASNAFVFLPIILLCSILYLMIARPVIW